MNLKYQDETSSAQFCTEMREANKSMCLCTYIQIDFFHSHPSNCARFKKNRGIN